MAGPWEKYQQTSGPWSKYQKQDEFAGIDFDQPIEDLRPVIAQLPEQSRDKALSRWAQGKVSKERETLAGYQLPRLAEGVPVLGGLYDEWNALIGAAGHALTGAGNTYSETLALERERSKQADAAMPVTAGVGKMAAGVVTGGPVLGRAFNSPTVVGQIARGVGVGGALGAVEGFTRGEGGFDNRARSAEDTAQFSAAVGGAIPIAAAGAQRAYGAYADYIQPGITAARSGPAAAADEILANRIYREGSSPQAKRLELQRGQNSARLDSNSRAELPETIADTSDAMQRLAGSAYRSGGEAGNVIRQSIQGRQRGADNAYTRNAPRPNDPGQQGQRGRLFDTVRRALLVRSRDGAQATERQIINDQRTQGRRLYQQAYDNSQDFDLSAPLTAMGININEHTGSHRATLQRALDLFVNRAVPGQPAAHTIRRFDAAKKQLDDMIDTAGRQGNNNLRRQLTEFKDDLLNAVHEGGRNPIYQQARAAWGSHAERREAIEMGRNAFRDDSEITLEAFNQLSPGNQALFRVGMVDGMRRLMSTKRPGDDLTRIFQQFRVQELMNGVIPRSQRGNSVFGNRAQRFGEILDREARMVQTRNNVLGNSATAQRQQDDAQFTGEALRGMWDRFRQAPGILNMAVEGVGYGLQRIFGYRQDVALELARRLMETDRTTQNQILRRLLARGGPDRFNEFARMTDETSRALQSSVPAALGAGGSVKIGDGRQ